MEVVIVVEDRDRIREAIQSSIYLDVYSIAQITSSSFLFDFYREMHQGAPKLRYPFRSIAPKNQTTHNERVRQSDAVTHGRQHSGRAIRAYPTSSGDICIIRTPISALEVQV